MLDLLKKKPEKVKVDVVNLEYPQPNVERYDFMGIHLPYFEGTKTEFEGRVKLVCPMDAGTANYLLTQRNSRNRMQSKHNIKKIGKELHYQHDPILIDEEGFLMSGQHRLQIIVNNDLVVNMDVVLGVPDDVRSFIDTGRTRGLRDYFALEGFNTRDLHNAVKMTYIYTNTKSSDITKRSVVNGTIVEYYKQNKAEFDEGMKFVKKGYKRKNCNFNFHIALFVYIITSRVDKNKAQSFIIQLMRKSEEEDCFAFVQRFCEKIANKTLRTHNQTMHKIEYILKAWVDYKNGVSDRAYEVDTSKINELPRVS
jgi:hypothetical protein